MSGVLLESLPSTSMHASGRKTGLHTLWRQGRLQCVSGDLLSVVLTCASDRDSDHRWPPFQGPKGQTFSSGGSSCDPRGLARSGHAKSRDAHVPQNNLDIKSHRFLGAISLSVWRSTNGRDDRTRPLREPFDKIYLVSPTCPKRSRPSSKGGPYSRMPMTAPQVLARHLTVFSPPSWLLAPSLHPCPLH